LPPPAACVASGVGTAFAVFFDAGDVAAVAVAAGLAVVEAAFACCDFFRCFLAGVIAAEGLGLGVAC